MLVELEDSKGTPFLLEAGKVAIKKAFLGREVQGVIVISSNPDQGLYSTPETHEVSLTYDQFRWAYVQSKRNGEPILELKAKDIERIRHDYSQAARKGPTHDPSPYRPG